MKRVLIGAATAAVAACASGASQRTDGREHCAPDATLYSYGDTVRGVHPPVPLRLRMPRGGLSRITVRGIVGVRGRIERRSVRTFGGGDPDERLAAGDALFWTPFAPATRGGCAVRFLYRVTYMAGIPQHVPDEPPDSTTVADRSSVRLR